MYLARFSYAIRPIDRDKALDLLRHQVEAARDSGLQARLLIPLTRASGGAALQVEVLLPTLEVFDVFREEGVGGEAGTRNWARDLSDLLLEPPAVELLRISASTLPDESGASYELDARGWWPVSTQRDRRDHACPPSHAAPTDLVPSCAGSTSESWSSGFPIEIRSTTLRSRAVP